VGTIGRSGVVGAVLAAAALLPSAAGADDGVPYAFSCSVGAPLTVHGHVPASVAAGEDLAVSDVRIRYTNPIGPVAYGGTRVTVPAPPGTSGSDLVVEVPETVTLGRRETYTSPPTSGTFRATGPPGTVVELRPSTLVVESASTVGGRLACDFAPDQSAFARTTIGGGPSSVTEASPEVLNRRVSGSFSGTSSYVHADAECDFAHVVYDGTYHPPGHPRRTGAYHIDVCITLGSDGRYRADGTFALRTIGRAVVTGVASGTSTVDTSTSPTRPSSDAALTLTITGGTKRFRDAGGTVELEGTSVFDLDQQTTLDTGELVGTVTPGRG